MKIQLKESQIKNLIKGYKGILNEQFEGETKSVTVDLGTTFASGKYKLTPQMVQNMRTKFVELDTFLKQNPTAKLSIKVTAGESRVTNYDREKCQNGDYSEQCKLQPKALSELRGKSINELLGRYLQEKNIQNKPTFLPTETVLGSTSYKAGVDNPEDEKYRKEQFVKVTISAEASYECLVGATVEIAYDTDGHSCDEAIFQLLINDVPIGVANLNNGSRDVSGYTNLERKGAKYYIEKHNMDLVNPLPEFTSIWNPIYSAIRKEGINNYKPNLPDYGLNGDKTFGELGVVIEKGYGYNVKVYLKKLFIEKNDFKGKIVYDPNAVVTSKMVRQSKQPLNQFLNQKMGANEESIEIVKKLANVEGRVSDGKNGGKRSQIFKLDKNLAKSIVEKGTIKDKLIFSLKALVGVEGPYKVLYRSGSHSAIPSVYIKGINGDERYSGQPNKDPENKERKLRGYMEATPILTTDLCGNRISSTTN